jgi:MYXO-CTERM domain-containing protein
MATLAVFSLSARPAAAHFVLDAPASWMSQDPSGLPEKLGPCGDEDDGNDAAATPSGIVTVFQEGQAITVTIEEVVFHPGHYRIALAVHDRSELPPEPQVTAADSPCGSAAIEDPPAFPVLADDVFDHTTPFSSPQSVQILLPPNVTCTKCTLQIIEFMSEHALNDPGGCFYHHCADIAIEGAAGDGSAAAIDGGEGNAGSSEPGPTAGCGCSTAGHEASWVPPLVALGLAVSLARTRRRRR